MFCLLYNICLFGVFFFKELLLVFYFFDVLDKWWIINMLLKIMKLYNFIIENVNKVINVYRYFFVYWIIVFLLILLVDNGILF